MTNSVNTDALRKLLYNDTAVEVIRLRQALSATADEVDRLRAENEHLAGELSAVVANRDHTADEFRRLRSVIGNAPHMESCRRFYLSPPNAQCTCWKADTP